ncbi:MAG: hypothetical protein AAF483_10405 [Planctomycetota bacterium]
MILRSCIVLLLIALVGCGSRPKRPELESSFAELKVATQKLKTAFPKLNAAVSQAEDSGVFSDEELLEHQKILGEHEFVLQMCVKTSGRAKSLLNRKSWEASKAEDALERFEFDIENATRSCKAIEDFIENLESEANN